MKEHNPTFKGKSFSVDVCENGFIVKYSGAGIGLETKVFKTYTEVVEEMAHRFGLLGIAEKLPWGNLPPLGVAFNHDAEANESSTIGAMSSGVVYEEATEDVVKKISEQKHRWYLYGYSIFEVINGNEGDAEYSLRGLCEEFYATDQSFWSEIKNIIRKREGDRLDRPAIILAYGSDTKWDGDPEYLEDLIGEKLADDVELENFLILPNGIDTWVLMP